ncbi:MAG: UDP-N-acetylglucosamine 2-epimerase (non-hydrolyzing) [Saprospiraceae bacterium]
MIDIDLIAGARPNFIKISAIYHALDSFNKQAEKPIVFRLIHTGQHFDKNMSGDFFEQLGIRDPDVNFAIGSGTQARQKAGIMIAYEKLLMESPARICVVVGDVNSTVACSIAAIKLGVKVAHVEAGIRSYDRTMPEEINRLLTDAITDIFFTTSRLAGQNLLDSGFKEDQIHFVGNTMIDTLYRFKSQFEIPVSLKVEIGDQPFVLLTMHRPSNVDHPEVFKKILNSISETISKDFKIVFPVHPRTKKVLQGIKDQYTNVIWTTPQPYFAFMGLLESSRGIMTDSGGVTEEATVLGIPCITLRNSTERPETVDIGTNILIGKDLDLLVKSIKSMCKGNWKSFEIPELWDGKTGERIVKVLNDILL